MGPGGAGLENTVVWVASKCGIGGLGAVAAMCGTREPFDSASSSATGNAIAGTVVDPSVGGEIQGGVVVGGCIGIYEIKGGVVVGVCAVGGGIKGGVVVSGRTD